MPAYRCEKCGLTSRAFLTAAGAREHGAEHRARAHGGDFPDGECLVANEPFLPQTSQEWKAVLAVVALLAASWVWHHVFG
ncbi:hypothetical protein [Streptomyces sp. NRRL S-350]|uniref:hypothetical protein n=1 Tax=Streptomyces sp. NRRL S-350 TaxID=1463902 RepID=UPI0004C0340E|nr:hypothetical protein [Streptomyces sp. NRRL S-350]